WHGALGALATDPAAAGLGSPAVILVGMAIGEALAMLPAQAGQPAIDAERLSDAA
ncbi:uroporphyrinogen-III C-methyltransferase, partial [Burkholderia gladioli]